MLFPLMPTWLERAWHDLRYGLRVFAKSPGFTAIAVVSIACGTGANIAMFSAVDALLLRPLPVARPGELVTLGSALSHGVWHASRASYPDFEDIRTRSASFSSLVAYHTRRAGVALGPADPKQVKTVTAVTANFFDGLGVDLQLGRGFRDEEDDVPGRDAVAVLSHGMWQQFFGGDPAVVGRTLTIAGAPFTVVGVAHESFTGIEIDNAREAAYVPLAMWATVMNTPAANPLAVRDLRSLTVKGRLRRGVSLGQARADLAAIGEALAIAYPATNTGQRLIAQTEFEVRIGRTPLRAALVLFVSVLSLVVLFVACANVAGLLTSRAPMRAREFAVRLAVGAGRVRLVRQLLTESLLIALVGGGGGLGVGYLGIRLSSLIHFPTDIVAAPVFRMDERALVFSLVVAMASVVLFGLGPALTTTRIDLSNSFRSTELAGRQRWRAGGRSQLIALQVALSLVMLTVAGITIETFTQAFTKGPGFRTTQMAKLSMDAGQARYSEEASVAFFQNVATRTRDLPGVTKAGLTSAMPLWEVEVLRIFPEGAETAEAEADFRPFANVVDEGYFETMEIPLVRGRRFSDHDAATAPRVAIVNDELAKRHWPGADPIGRRFRVEDERGPWVAVVGVVKNSLYFYPAEPPQEMLYLPFRQHPRSDMTLLAQTTGASADALPAMRAVVHDLDAAVPLYDAQTIERYYDALATSLGRVILWMITGLGVMGIAITVIGLYGLVSYAVSRRTREIGIRIAIGATYGRVLRMLLRQGLTPAWVGIGVGLMLSIVTARLLPAAGLFSHSSEVRALLVLVPGLLAVTLFAAFVPARRAASADPTVALRHE